MKVPPPRVLLFLMEEGKSLDAKAIFNHESSFNVKAA